MSSMNLCATIVIKKYGRFLFKCCSENENCQVITLLLSASNVARRLGEARLALLKRNVAIEVCSSIWRGSTERLWQGSRKQGQGQLLRQLGKYMIQREGKIKKIEGENWKLFGMLNLKFCGKIMNTLLKHFSLARVWWESVFKFSCKIS